MTSYPFLRTLAIALAGSLLCLELNAQRIVCDETCKLSDAPPAAAKAPVPAAKAPAPASKTTVAKTSQPAPKEEPGFAVVSPVGRYMNLALMNLCGYYVKQGGYATVGIELPAQWDKLMAELGYRPLKEFYLK